VGGDQEMIAYHRPLEKSEKSKCGVGGWKKNPNCESEHHARETKEILFTSKEETAGGGVKGRPKVVIRK